ncbi:hypothetical protein T260_11215 [Geobacillus thermopakistaniensis]|uniref:Uncharacterized protein n=3 Tax=Geobacillus TaxID=129337 RepID=A0A7U9JAC6_GEOTM|nr:hypothetical protein [Geobacillus sp. MAS1]ESU71911.1 hypothetical protein T260_11215 [Geobacillus sp. MAS1]
MKKLLSFSLFMFVMLFSAMVPLASASNITSDKNAKNVNRMLELLGFSKEDIKDLKANKFDVADIDFKNKDVRNLKLKKKDILFLAHFGFTKERIEHFTLNDWDHFKNMEEPELVDVNVSYFKVDENNGELIPITKYEFEENKKQREAYYDEIKKNPNVTLITSLCDPDNTCNGSNSSSMVKLTVAVTHSSKYAIVSDFDWVNDSNERHVDLFGTGHKEALTVNYESIFGSWTTEYYDNYGYVAERTSYFNGATYKFSTGYVHKLDRNSSTHQEFWQYNGKWIHAQDDSGYTYAEFVWSSGTSSSAYANYTHMKTGWSSSFSVSMPLGASISVSGTTSYIQIPNAAVSFTR